jgi:hypothetical protein
VFWRSGSSVCAVPFYITFPFETSTAFYFSAREISGTNHVWVSAIAEAIEVRLAVPVPMRKRNHHQATESLSREVFESKVVRRYDLLSHDGSLRWG